MREFSMKDKIGYTLGDLGCCCTEQFRAMFLTVFYTLVLKVNPLHVGTILLITKIWDAINDPIIGALIDARKSTKGGRFIPWIKAFSIPMAIMCVIGFLDVSSFDYKLKLIYILVTYVLYEALYTCVNVPFGSLSSVMTDDVNHRTDLSRYRSLGGTIFMTVVVIAGPLVLYKDNNPIPSRFTLMALICATIGVFCLMITSSWCKERVSITVEKREKFNYFEALKHIIKNRALLGLIFSSLAGMIAASVVNGLNTYLFKDYFQAPGLLSLAGLLPMVGTFLAIPVTGKLVAKFGKKNIAIYSGIVSIAAYVVLVLFPTKNPMLYIALITVSGFGTALYGMIVWALVGDVIDYQEYLSGKREEGIVYATYSLSRKLVQAIVGSIGGFALAAIGYQSGAATQAPEVAESIRTIITVVPLIGFIFGTVCLKFVYNLSNKTLNEVNEELERRRAQ